MKTAPPFGKDMIPKPLEVSTKSHDHHAMQRPWISVNFAISADGKITSAQRCASGWTSPADHQRLLDLRKGADALMVGKGTLLADRMTLTAPGRSVQPLRCIVSKSGRLPKDHPLFQKPGGDIHLCVTEGMGEEMPGVTLHRMTLKKFLESLAENFSIRHLHCEGGGELVHALAEMGAVDEFHATLAGHTLFGGRNAVTATGIPAAFLSQSLVYELTHFEPLAELGECFVSYRRKI